jgi:uncharacterized protein with FMN-binding domain
MPEEPNRPTQKIIAVIGLVVIVIIAAAVIILSKKDKDTSTSSTGSTTTSDTTATDHTSPDTGSTADTTGDATTDDTAASTYKDGTYTATGRYTAPSGAESVTVSVTIQDDVVTASTATGNATDREAREYQADFVSGYKSQVVGKSISSISLSRVSGSSLTPKGFNDALEQIKNQAKA